MKEPNFFGMLTQIHENSKLIEKFWQGRVKNDCGLSGDVALKLTVSQERIDGRN